MPPNPRGRSRPETASRTGQRRSGRRNTRNAGGSRRRKNRRIARRNRSGTGAYQERNREHPRNVVYDDLSLRTDDEPLGGYGAAAAPSAAATNAKPAGRTRDRRPRAASHVAPRTQPRRKPTIAGQVWPARRRAVAMPIETRPSSISPTSMVKTVILVVI